MRLTRDDVYPKVRRAGFSVEVTALIMSILEAESGLDTTARNTNTDGSVDRGIAQFNSRWHPEISVDCADDPDCAMREMFRVSSGGRDLSPWSTFVQGANQSRLAAIVAYIAEHHLEETYSGPTGGDVYHRQDAWPPFFSKDTGLVINGGATQRINTRVDFGWPPNARAGEVEFLLKKGYVVVKHGDGSQAGRVGYGVRPGNPSYGVVRIVPDASGWIELLAEEINNPVQFLNAHGIAYWT